MTRLRGPIVELAKIRTAASMIADQAVVTPVLRSDELDRLTSSIAFAKDESSQRAGAFKFRGAYHRLRQIPLDHRSRGVVAVSSGNHGAAVACAAQLLGIATTVHVPDDVAAAKRALIEDFGADIVTFPRATVDREVGAREQVAATGATFVHPFEDPMVMAGQGTTALEFHEQVGSLDVLLVPTSGGGLMAGCASAMFRLDPGCELIAVEPATADDTRRSFAAGERVTISAPATIADGLAITSPGAATFAINRHLVSDVVTVTDAQLIDAMRVTRDLLHRRLEPSGVAGVAALLSDPHRFRGLRVGMILSGGNIDDARFESLTA